MAQAMKCDRCGEFYTIEKRINILHKYQIGGLAIEPQKVILYSTMIYAILAYLNY